MKVYRPTRELLAEVDRALATPNLYVRRELPLEDTVQLLYAGRHYFWIGIYLLIGDNVVRQVFRGPAPVGQGYSLGSGSVGVAAQTGISQVIPDVSRETGHRHAGHDEAFAATKSEIAVPIKIAGRVLGVIDVQSDKLNAFSYGDRVFLKNVAQRLAKFLTGRGKYVVRKAREAAAKEKKIETRGYQPASEKASAKAIAMGGERSRR